MNIQEEINDLILRRLSGENLTEAEQATLRLWIRESKEHKKAYTELCSVWYAGEIGEKRKQGQNEAAWETIMRKRKKKSRRRVLFQAVSAAASVLIIWGGFQLFKPSSTVRPIETTVTELVALQDPAKVKLILSSGREIQLGKQITEQEAGTSIYSDSAGLSYAVINPEAEKETVYNELVIPKCGEYNLTLADGTNIILNSESSLRFPVHFSGNTREVWFTGEAYFKVTHNEKKPFIIHSGDVTVKVLGTSFNVMAYENEKNQEITLEQGEVEIGIHGQKELLKPGHQVAVNKSTSQMVNRKVDVESYISWKSGILRFDDMPLEQLLNRLTRWYNIAFEFRKEDLKKKVFTGGFKKYESIGQVLEMIEATNDVKFSVQNNKVVIDHK